MQIHYCNYFSNLPLYLMCQIPFQSKSLGKRKHKSEESGVPSPLGVAGDGTDVPSTPPDLRGHKKSWWQISC